MKSRQSIRSTRISTSRTNMKAWWSIGDPTRKAKRRASARCSTAIRANNFSEARARFQSGRHFEWRTAHRIAGTYAYMLCDRGLVVVDLNEPLQPRVAAEIGAPELHDPRGIAIQFRYAFVVDHDGLKVLDVSALDHPRVVPNAVVRSKTREISTSRALTRTSRAENKVVAHHRCGKTRAAETRSNVLTPTES